MSGIESGYYTLTNVYYKHMLRVDSTDIGIPVHGAPNDDSLYFRWHIEKYGPQTYGVKNLGSGTFATPQSDAHVGTEVVTGNTVYTWKFGDTYVRDHYTISPLGQTVGLVWGISTDGFKTPVRLATSYTDHKNQWKLERLSSSSVHMPSSGSASTGLPGVPAGDAPTDHVDRGPADIPSNPSQTHAPSPDSKHTTAEPPQLKSARYRVTNVYNNNAIRVTRSSDPDPLEVIAQIYTPGNKYFWWDIKELGNGHYSIRNVGAGAFASSEPGASTGSHITIADTVQKFRIFDASSNSGHYLISDTGSRLLWGLVNDELDSPVTLVTAAGDTRNQWIFVRILHNGDA